MTVPMVDYPTTITDLLRAFNISEWLWALQNFQLISGIFFPRYIVASKYDVCKESKK